MKQYKIIFFVFLLSNSLFAQKDYCNVKQLIQSPQGLSIHTISSIHDSSWENNYCKINKGLTNNEFWLKVNIPATNQMQFIEFESVFIKGIAYYYDKNQLVDSLKFDINQDNRDNQFPFIPAKTESIYCKVWSDGMLYSSINIKDTEELEIGKRKRNIFGFFLFGFMFFVFVFNFVASIFFRLSMFFFYSIWIFVLIIHSLSLSGIGHPIIFKDLFSDVSNLSLIFMPILEILYMTTMLSILPHKEYKFVRITAYTIITIALFSILIYPFSTKNILFIMHNIIPVISMILILIFSIFFYKKYRFEYLKFFLFGIILFDIGVIITTLMQVGVLPVNGITQNAHYVGGAIETIFFTFAFLSLITKGKNKIPIQNTDNQLDQFNFSKRELEVIELLELGHSNQKIADELFISLNTIKFHLKNIYAKLKVNSKSEAIYKINKFNNLK